VGIPLLTSPGWSDQYSFSPIIDHSNSLYTLEGSPMKLQSLAAVAALATCLFAGSAFADGRIAVALENPLAAKTKVVAGGAVFVCEGAECVSTAAPSRALTAVSCKALAKEVGRVAAFGGDTKSLDADDLTRCNASAKAAVQTAAK
jgi:hypothetical protein